MKTRDKIVIRLLKTISLVLSGMQLCLLDEEHWEPRFDKNGEVYMWLKRNHTGFRIASVV